MTGPALTASEIFHRGTGFFNPEENERAHATFVGVGGIGSFAAFATAKLGVPNITLIDPDTVEAHNAPNQLHAITDIGVPKVEALATQIQTHIGTVPVALQAKIGDRGWECEGMGTLPGDLNGVVVSGFDNMTARKDLWETKLKMNPSVSLYIDARLSGELILVYTLCPYDLDAIEKYEKTLHGDGEGEAVACTERGVIDVGFFVGGLIANLIRKHYAGKAIDPLHYVALNSLEIMKGGWM